MTLADKIKLFAVAKFRDWGVKDLYNFLFSRKARGFAPTGLRELDEILAKSAVRTDFSDHLVTVFCEALAPKPGLIVELGTRGGESTFVFERAARLCGARLLSVDIADCSRISQYEKWDFVQSDDVAFAGKFGAWCAAKGLKPEIDVLFIDTSHEYGHTVREIAAWFPFVARAGKVIFHDTNLKYLISRKDGSLDVGWDNQRGVIRALEEHLGCRWNEKRDFTDVRQNWLIRHWSGCSGLTVLERI